MNDIDRTDRRLRARHSEMGDDLDAQLDLDGGLREVLIAAQHRDLGRDLDDILDADAGMQAIVPTKPDTVPPVVDPPISSTKIYGAVATLLMSLDTPARLVIRNHPALDALTMLFILIQARLTTSASGRALSPIRAHDLALDLNRAHDCALVLEIGHDRVHARQFARSLALLLAWACDRAYALARDRDLARIRARTHDLDLALARLLDRALALDGIHDLALDRDLAPAVNLALNRDFARARAAAYGLTHRDLDPSVEFDLQHAHEFDHDLDRARHDFTTADLRGINLTNVQLDRLRWSRHTQWPTETSRNQALQDSTEIEPGIYEIRGGATHVPTHS